MRVLTSFELELLEELADSSGTCVADRDWICEQYTPREQATLAALEVRRLVTPYICGKCLELARLYGTRTDDDLMHYNITSTGRLAIRLARTVDA